MKFWQVVSWNETEHMLEVARTAQKLGFEGVILAEHPIMPHSVSSAYPYSPDGKPPMTDEMEFADPLITFGAMAAVTQKLRFMTGVYLLGLRHPVVAAKELATLAMLSKNRFTLGVGSGWLQEEHEMLGVDFNSRGRRLNECIQVLHKLWSGTPVNHSGEFFDFEKIQIRPFPDQPIPIFGGGTSAPALRRSASHCDGWYGPGNSLEELPAILTNLRSRREKAGLSWTDFEIVAPLSAPVTESACHQLEELGVHGTVNYPFLFGCSPGASLQEKQDYMADFARRFIE